jgi:integrase
MLLISAGTIEEMPRAGVLEPVAAPADPLAPIRRLLLDAVGSPITRVAYARALDGYTAWRGTQPFTRASVQAYRSHLEAQGLAPSSVNQQLAALKKLAREAAANGLLYSEAAAGIAQVPGARQSGTRTGNWLTQAQAETLLHAPDAGTLKGKRDRAALALLVGCGLRRGEAVALTLTHVQQREGRWVIVDLRGKHGRIRTVPVPAWVKHAVDVWTAYAGITEGRILRGIDRHGKLSDSLSGEAIRLLTAEYGTTGTTELRPHDLRRTCAKLCRKAGGELEQIQLLLGHASVQTTERYLGTRQDLAQAPNDRLGLKWREE